MLRIKRILVPVDFSNEAQLAVEWAVRLAKEEKEATIVLLHNLTPLVMLPEGGFEVGQMIEARFKKARETLEMWLRKIPPPLTSTSILTQGELVEAVSSACDKENIDMVVMTTHGRQGVKRMVRPNVTEKVVRIAPCPVLVLHLTSKIEKMVEEVA